ncbi:VWA domain-containing protein [Dysgonomonas sp. 520]|uniref:vWA domain-containing protein n=1 Tax=Dysgonomonas sp. 520 TaxID=2302931 RepID=UPI0013D6BEC5|nr:vWA domain-containing protein [Dysgonomonas sp. 520]NDW08410.1 VWA domain-containing protein [Dysgonomonas sp. 520]
MKKILLLSTILLMSMTTISSCNRTASANEEKTVEVSAPTPDEVDAAPAVTKIQVAILLDTSGSMNGLIEQAKARLWNIVNTLTTLKYKGRTPKIEIALYEYGSSRRFDGDYIRQITPLTTDLDKISEELFSLTTGGSEEYCGTVISKATKDLEWGNNEADMKLIYIAGNEIFEQGRISYKNAIPEALRKNIYVNTIHCGNESTGIRDLWRDAANRGKGKFFNIDHNERVRHYVTPYDDRISSCNARLNDTYISYGSSGYARQQMQMRQDENAKSVSSSNLAERAVSKSKSVYSNSEWDLVDKLSEDSNALAEVEQEYLPSELQGKSNKEIEKVIAEKQKEREAIQKEINDLAKKRQEYIDAEMKKGNSGDDLGKAIAESITEFANKKGYTIDKN